MIKKKIRPLLDKLTFHPAALESILAEMVLQGFIQLDEVELYAKSTFARGYSRDIKSSRLHEYDDQTVLQLETNREGYYDQLPQGLFHRPQPRNAGDTVENRIDTYKTTRSQEGAARKFFTPFEQNGFLFGIKTEMAERKLIDPFSSSLRERMLLEIWPACRQISKSYYPILSYILPLSHQVAGDLPRMESCYFAIARVPVAMEYVVDAVKREDQGSAHEGAGNGMQLGINMIMDGVPTDELPALQITIGPLRRAETHKYLEGGEIYKILRLLSDCLVPLDVNTIHRLTYHEEEDIMILNDEPTEASFLGYTSSLSLDGVI